MNTFFTSIERQATWLIQESCNELNQLEYSPLDGYQYPLLTIVKELLSKWKTANVYAWLIQVYESYQF